VTKPLDEDDLARCVHENVIATFVLAGTRMEGGHVERFEAATLVTTGLPVLLFNQVLVNDGHDVAVTRASVEQAVAHFRGLGKRYAVTLRGGQDEPYYETVQDLGLVALPDSPWMPGMAMHPLRAPAEAVLPAGHEIRPVSDATGLAHHAQVLSAGFGMPLEWATAFTTAFLTAEPSVSFYVGYQDGEPVTSGLGVRTGRTIGVYNIATVEAARRRGLGAAMTQRVVDDGAAAGCDVAILQASDTGLPVYVRLGFQTVVEYYGYTEPGAGE
jgi:GNAT superfamily N-acetyltransferase